MEYLNEVRVNKAREILRKSPEITAEAVVNQVGFCDVRYMNIIEYADELGLIVLTHAGVDSGLPDPIHCPPDKMRKVIDIIKPKIFPNAIKLIVINANKGITGTIDSIKITRHATIGPKLPNELITSSI